jgi:hypothetical protein
MEKSIDTEWIIGAVDGGAEEKDPECQGVADEDETVAFEKEGRDGGGQPEEAKADESDGEDAANDKKQKSNACAGFFAEGGAAFVLFIVERGFELRREFVRIGCWWGSGFIHGCAIISSMRV